MNEQLQNELEEQARLLGVSAERECDLRGKIERLERERDEFRQIAINAERELQRMKQLVVVKRSNNRSLDARNKRLERELDEARSDLEFRRDLFQLQEKQLNEVRAERDALQEQLDAAIMLGKMQERRHERDLEELAAVQARLLDPHAVYINMLHGKIAKLDWPTLEHINGPHPLREQLDAERDLADRLAAALMSTDSIIRKEVSLIGQWSSPDVCKEALAAWKEVRKEH